MKSIILILLILIWNLNCRSQDIDSLYKSYSKDSIISFAFEKSGLENCTGCRTSLELAIKDYANGVCVIPDYYYLRSWGYNWPQNRKWFAFQVREQLFKVFQSKCNCDRERNEVIIDDYLFYYKYMDDKLRIRFGNNYFQEFINEANNLNKDK